MIEQSFNHNRQNFREIISKKQLVEEMKTLLSKNTKWFDKDIKLYDYQLYDIVNNFLEILKYPLDPIKSGVYKLTLTNVGTFYQKYLKQKKVVMNVKKPIVLPERYIPSFIMSQTARKRYKQKLYQQMKEEGLMK
jgi:hypothetical protein